METIILLTITVLLLSLSFIKDRKKTKKALKMTVKKIKMIGMPILFMITLLSLVLHFLPPEVITEMLTGGHIFRAAVSAALAGSIAVMPGFIAFPLGGLLRDNGVPYMVIAAFTSTLMMTGVLTLPVEKQYLGTKVAVFRNLAAFAMAIITALVTGIAFGEFIV